MSIVVPIRLALIFFWASNYITHIVRAFLATGILRLRSGWRYLLLIEGCLTLGDLLSWLRDPRRQKHGSDRGWFTDRFVIAYYPVDSLG